VQLLDVGSGPGSITLDLAAVVAPGEVVGIDIEPLQVDRARALAAERGVTNVRFEPGDAYALPFPDDSFDVVFSNAALMWLRDPLAALREFRRVLRTGGVVGISDIVHSLTVFEPTTPLLAESQMIMNRVRELQRGRPAGLLDFQQRQLLLEAGFSRPEGQVRVESFGTPDAVRTFGMCIAAQLDEPFRPTILSEGWADSTKVDAMVAELRAWAERPDSFGCGLWCAAVGWVDGDAAGPGA
jgi:SAM-dependent methyltransferase